MHRNGDSEIMHLKYIKEQAWWSLVDFVIICHSCFFGGSVIQSHSLPVGKSGVFKC